ncbi:MAG: hypothetical protein B7733_02745 [Myxococcales bacterium FL481]|nr:MAG: hypothetical protein B7733_02745 [Myxococcales bacterium FL481]
MSAVDGMIGRTHATIGPRLAQRLECGRAAQAYLERLLGIRWQADGVDEPELQAFASRVVAMSSDAVQVFVVVHHGNFPHVEYLAAVLRARGSATVGIYLQSSPPAGVFSVSFDCHGSLARLVAAARALAAIRRPQTLASAWYLQAHGRWCFLAALLDEVVPGVRVVQELWDWMDLFVAPGCDHEFVRARVFEQEELDLMRAAEEYARHRTAGFLYKNRGEAMDRLLAGARAPGQPFLPCPPASWVRSPRARERGHQPSRLVHAGQLKNADASNAVFGDIKYHGVVRRLCSLGFSVTAYGSVIPGDRSAAEFHRDYVRLAEEPIGFTFHERLPVRRLIEQLNARYDFGLLFYRFPAELCVGREHLESTIASKLFTYLAAGLPVIVSPELQRMAAFVRDRGVGIVLTWSEVERLPELVRQCDYPRLCERVGEVQQTHHLEQFVEGTLSFVKRCA